MSYELTTQVRYEDSPNIDANGRLRVSQLTSQYDGKQLYDKLPLFVDEEIIGLGRADHNLTFAKTEIVTPTNGDDVILQTKQRFNYQSGKSQLILFTFENFGGSAAFSDNLSVVTTRSGTETSRVIRADWDDPLDGSGVSGVTHDFRDNTIFAIDYEWSGVGRVRYYIKKNGVFILFHSVDFTNETDVYMASPNQPLS